MIRYFIFSFVLFIFGSSPIKAQEKDSLSVPTSSLLWLDEWLFDYFQASTMSMDGKRWYSSRSLEGSPTGLYAGRYSSKGYSWFPEINGSLHPFDIRALYRNSNNSTGTFVDLNYANRSGDSGPWAATERITPNTDRIGPDLSIRSVFKLGNGRFSMHADYFSTAIDGLNQLKRLKTILDGDAVEGLRMPLSDTFELGIAFKNTSAFNSSLRYRFFRGFDFDATTAFELPYQQQSILYSLYAELFNTDKISTNFIQDIRYDARSEYVNALGYEPNFSITRMYQEIDVKYAVHEKWSIFSALKTKAFIASNTIGQRNGSMNILTNSGFGYTVNTFRFKIIGGISSFLNLNRLDYKPTMNAELHYYTSKFRVDASYSKEMLNSFEVDLMTLLRTNSFNYGLSSLFNEQNLSISHTNLQEQEFIERDQLSVSIEQSMFGTIGFTYTHWSDIYFTASRFRFNPEYPTEDRALPLNVDQSSLRSSEKGLNQWSLSFASKDFLIPINFLEKPIRFNIHAQWLRQANLRAPEFEYVHEIRFPELQFSLNTKIIFPYSFQLWTSYRYRSSVQWDQFTAIHNQLHGIQRNFSAVEYGVFSRVSDRMHQLNVQLSKQMGLKKNSTLFLAIKNVPLTQSSYSLHPLGAIEPFTLLVGIRLNVQH